MISAPTYSVKGDSMEKTGLPKEVFEVKVSSRLMAQAVRVFLMNQRKSNAKTKTRGEVKKTTAKMYKQKGTGNARHGSYGAPIFVGGGIAHGPSGEQNYERRMPKEMARRALAGSLSLSASEKRIAIIAGAEKGKVKTKDVATFLAKIQKGQSSTLLITTGEQKVFCKAWRNLKGVTVKQSGGVHPYYVLKAKSLFITQEAMEEMKSLVLGK